MLYRYANFCACNVHIFCSYNTHVQMCCNTVHFGIINLNVFRYYYNSTNPPLCYDPSLLIMPHIGFFFYNIVLPFFPLPKCCKSIINIDKQINTRERVEKKVDMFS